MLDVCRLFVTSFVAAMAVLRDKVLQQLPIELTNSWISIVDERKFNADVGAHHYFWFLHHLHLPALAAALTNSPPFLWKP